MQYSHLNHPITYFDVKKAFEKLEIYLMSWLSNAKNEVGIYYHQKYVDNWKVSFSHVSKNKRDPKRPTDVEVWAKFLCSNCIGHITQEGHTKNPCNKLQWSIKKSGMWNLGEDLQQHWLWWQHKYGGSTNYDSSTNYSSTTYVIRAAPNCPLVISHIW